MTTTEEPVPCRRRRRMRTPPPMDPEDKSTRLYDQLVESAYFKLDHAAEELGEIALAQREASNKRLQERLDASEGVGEQSANRSCESSPKVRVNFPVSSLPCTEVPDSPPPPVPTDRTHRKRRLSKGVRQAFNKLETTNRRIVVDQYSDQLHHITQHLSQGDGVLDSPVSDKVRVRFKTPHNGLLRVELGRDDSILSARRKISEMEGVPENRLELFLKDSRIRAEDSFRSLALSVADIIECLIINEVFPLSADRATTSDPAALGLAMGQINIKVQSSKGKRDVARIVMHCTEKFDVLIRKYCDMKSLDASSVRLRFDGEALDPSFTPQDVDMDDGDCIDVL